MLINLSNHPSYNWSQKQINAAKRKFGKIIDIPFPHISPFASTTQVSKKAEKYLNEIMSIIKSSADKINAVHLMGEFTFVILLYELLKKKKVPVIVSTSNRVVQEKNGKKIVLFDFVKFRFISG
ncbi:MAG: hypothetical protein NZM09_12290 [Ignavibacterium sp.]|nr:hypothetical protein [Ignavibacterium sp.]MDW8376454.1 hypothetical protein [Ignavibacteriales bacterium]